MDESKQENLEIKQENAKKVDGKYIFIPEGYMSVIIPIDDNPKHKIPYIEQSLYPTATLNASIPNNHPGSQVNSPSLNNINIMTDTSNTQENIKKSTQEQIIDSPFNVEEPTNKQSSNESNAKSKKDQKQKKIPRPKNSFIFYLQDKTPDFLKINPNINRREVSKAVGQMWRNESEEVKKIYAEKARIELEEHKLKYPNYKFAPDRSKKNKKNNDETKKADIRSRLSHQRTSSDDLSLIKEKITKKPQLRQRSISNSVFQSKKLDEIYKENKMDYDPEEIDNDQALYQTIINSIPNSANTNPQALEIALNMVNASNNGSFSSIDGSIHSSNYNESSSFIGTDYSSSFFDELSLSSYNNSFSEINVMDPTNPNNLLENMNNILTLNPNQNLTGTDPMMTHPSSILPLDADPSVLNIDNSLAMTMNDPLSTLIPSYQVPLSNPIIPQPNDNKSITGVPPQINNMTIGDTLHSPSFDAIIAPALNTNDISNLQASLNTNDLNNMILPEALNPGAFADLTNTIIPTDIPSNDIIESTVTVPSNDTSYKSKRLSQIQQKNNLRIVTSAENLDELAASFDLPSSATTNTVSTNISNTNSNGIDTNTTGSNKSTPSYLISKMSLMENFNALNLNNSNKYKSPIHTQPHPHARSHRHGHHHNQSQCNSASVVMDNKPAFPLTNPLSAGLWYTDQNLGLQNGPRVFDFSNVNSATASGPSTHSGNTSATTNTSGTHSFNFGMTLDSRSSSHENLEASNSNGSIHSTTRTSSSIVKKTKPMGYGMKLNHKKNSSLSKLNRSNSLLSASDSYDSSSATASSSSLQLNPEEIQALSLEPAVVVDPQLQPPTSTIDFLNLNIDNDEIEYNGFSTQQ